MTVTKLTKWPTQNKKKTWTRRNRQNKKTHTDATFMHKIWLLWSVYVYIKKGVM